MAKTKRRNCDYCGKQYRYERSTSKTCGGSCRNRLSERARILESVAQPKTPGVARDYTKLAKALKPVEPEFYDGPSDEEYMRALMREMVPNGIPRAPSAPPRTTEREGPPRYITIHNVPTRFPGTPPRYGRQLMP